MLADRVFLAEEANKPIGFASLRDDGHIGALYVHGDHQGRGALLRVVLATADEAGIDRLHAEASAFRLPLFEKMGFTVVGVETVERRGVQIERHRVEIVPPWFV